MRTREILAFGITRQGGESLVPGGEAAFVTRSFDLAFGVTRSGIDFSGTTLAGIPFPSAFDAQHWIVQVSAGFGIGR